MNNKNHLPSDLCVGSPLLVTINSLLHLMLQTILILKREVEVKELSKCLSHTASEY